MSACVAAIESESMCASVCVCVSMSASASASTSVFVYVCVCVCLSVWRAFVCGACMLAYATEDVRFLRYDLALLR